ncbi:hypothetical protein [Mucilaginibacter lacusdianchii]|uniref:hypothetical protein n=1 Tax=Mucilaginibacter lacusdianchii TaxID=2684211 RepID=UPI00131A8CCD|nr:hypothetical protein [Mucilaginibacter sp. JXJ CY 39]
MDEHMEKQTNSTSNQSSTKNDRLTNSNKRALLILTVVALVLLAGIWIWKSVEVSHAKKQAETEKQAIRQEAKGNLLQAHEAHLKLLAKPMVWALRTEMMQGNMGQVNLYLSDLVKEKNIQRVVIADTKGTIIASTNKKDEGQPFTSIAAGSIQNNDNATVQQAGDSVLMLTSPVMGFNNRLGTLLIKYNVPKTTF